MRASLLQSLKHFLSFGKLCTPRREKRVFAFASKPPGQSFEKQYGKGWNVVVGRSFGAYVTHEIKTYMYCSVVPGVCVLIWRCEGDPNAAAALSEREAAKT